MDEALAHFVVKDKMRKSHDDAILIQSKKKEWNKLRQTVVFSLGISLLFSFKFECTVDMQGTR